ncbi:hypothetical protein HHL16_13475 [Pseudoflavitalea sp. G-6-1-2]|uniref:DUF5689 domain-containing protein n=1 Tax=Pseudoflavitalea sp. G-6-1-2 TaxID=2728841 RepID=UPI00146A5E99|nr:DUF5689 domain-containing protein [Pseudoflavitalea sp. G-6-1-2]NML21894.1 hypothetical protein [Pseudoflavitalea sp. G-6-1-2]
MKILQYSLLMAGLTTFASCLKKDINPSEGVASDFASVSVVRDIYKGQPITIDREVLDGASKVYGVVTSDANAKNIAPGTFVMQGDVVTSNQVGDITRGIVVDLGGAAVAVAPGDSISIGLEGAKLSREDGRLVLSNVKSEKITKLATNAKVTIRTVTMAMLALTPDDYESTLVTVHANLTDYAAGGTFAGSHTMFDNTGGDLTLITRADADFAGSTIPANAGFTGIYSAEGGKRTLSLRNAADINFVAGSLYDKFPESFEVPDASKKGSYDMGGVKNDIDLNTGNWKLLRAILGNTFLRDKYNVPGKQCIRMQQDITSDGLLQMNYDLTEGISKVTFFYGKYYTDPVSTLKLEYSTNGGTTWKQSGPELSDMPDRGSKQAVFMVNVAGNVRIRINKRGLGKSSTTVNNGRLSIEDIAIHKAL